MAKSFDEIDVARMVGALSAYEEALRLAEMERERHLPHMADWRAANEIAYQLKCTRTRFAAAYQKKENDVALSGAISAAMTKKKRTRKSAHAN
jgi:hypothetical protein